MKHLFLLLAALTLFNSASAQTLGDTLAKIETLFNRYTPQTPGCQVAISRHGRVLFSKAWGLADLERGAPLTTASVVEAGSVSKQFTAAAILLLAQQGRLSLEDDVRKYVPELPDYGHPIRLRHLLRHTSGLKDWGAVAFLSGWNRGQKFYTNAEALDFLVHQKGLNNRPGAEFIYSNSNYNLAAVVVQRVSGMTLAAFTRQHIFEPAGMTRTQWRDNPNRVVPNRALAYEKVADGYQTQMPNESAYGNGGLLTAAEDLLKWEEFYLRGKMGTAPLLAQQLQTVPLTNGVANDYAAGLYVHETAGAVDRISHGGATAGYRAFLEAFPKTGLAVAVLSNTSQYNIESLATSVSNLFIPHQAGKAAAMAPQVTVPDATLRTYAGWYKNNRDGLGLQLVVNEGELLTGNKTKLVPQTRNRFEMNSNLVAFDEAKGLRVIAPNGDTVTYSKAAPALPPDKFSAYAGRYFSEETNSFLTVFQHDGKLKMRLNPHEEFELSPTFAHGFTAREAGVWMNFTKQRKNGMAVSLSLARARNVVFVRM